MTYVLWHTSRAGWVSNTGSTSTDFLAAMRLPRDEAIRRCKAAKSHDGMALVVPVLVNDIQEVLA